jgi:hypothetical protein
LRFKLTAGLSDKLTYGSNLYNINIYFYCVDVFVCVFLCGESGSRLTRVVASGVSWAVRVTHRPVSVTPSALGNLESAYNPGKKIKKDFTLTVALNT